MARGSTRARKQANADRPGVDDPTAPLDGGELLTAARPVLDLLRTDLEARATDPGVTRALAARYEDEKQRKLTGDSFAAWREARIAQIAASWFLSCVFVRTLEDRGLLGQARLAGPGAMDSQAMFFQLAPSLTERDYLLFVFRELAELPASRALFDREHALVWQLSPSAEAAKALLRLFRTPDAETPAFRFGQASTRFLGDLYQDLYEDVRKRFALLQTPDFVERFILDRTLQPAIARFGLDDTTLIDPTCGSGHFLLGAFDRLFEHRLRQTPGIDVKLAAQRALDAVFGADINPYAVAIARMRLTLAFLEKAGIGKLKNAPAPKLHLVVADSLRYNPQHVQLAMEHHATQDAKDWVGDAFPLEDEVAARDVLHRQYTAVVGNPPYITEKDPAKREIYRAMYPRSAAGKYALSAPFCERFFQLARDRGYVGQITANSFMKREFGKALIEDFLPTVNLELVLDSSGADIPGHNMNGTPTVMLFGTRERPISSDVLAALGKRSEPSTPDDPVQGLVWRSIVDHVQEVGFDNDYISVTRLPRTVLAKHPWSMGGGGAGDLKVLLEERTENRLEDLVEDIGFASFTGLDDAFILPASAAKTLGIETTMLRPMIIGECVRDWGADASDVAIAPYDFASHAPIPLSRSARWARFLWRFRTSLHNVTSFGGKTRQECGENWWEWYRWQQDRYALPLRITFAFVATHNHFVLDRGGNVFSRSAPIIQLPIDANEEAHLKLLAYLNSSTSCFWMKQVSFVKTSGTNVGESRGRPERLAYEFTGTALQPLPVPEIPARVGLMAQQLTVLAARRQALSPARIIPSYQGDRATIEANARDYDVLLQQMVVLQEEIDWEIYVSFGLADDDLLAVSQSVDVTGLRAPSAGRPFLGEPHCDEQLCGLWQKRREAIAKSSQLALIEQPLFKRPWLGIQGVFHRDGWTYEALTEVAIYETMANRVEDQLQGSGAVARTRVELVRALSKSGGLKLLGVSRVFESRSHEAVIAEILAREAIPFSLATTLTEAGLARRAQWEAVWAGQRDEDAGKPVELKPPDKYATKDFRDGNFYRLRGPLDVPKERFISYPGCESDADGEPVYGWAGWNHLQRARALAALYQKRKTEEGWTADRLTPMLAGLLELLPWIQQWHNELDPEYGLRMGDYFAQFLDGELATLGLTRAKLEAWRPTKRNSGRSVRKPKVAPAAAPMSRPSTQPQRKPRRQPRISPLPPMPAIRPQMPAELEAALVVVALLHVAGGALARTDLSRAFALRARPDLLTQLAPSSIPQAGEWARKVGERSVPPGMLASTLRTLVDRRGVELGIDAQSRSTVRTSTGTPAEAQLDPWFRFEAILALEVLRAQPTNAFDAIDATIEGEDHSLLEEAAR